MELLFPLIILLLWVFIFPLLRYFFKRITLAYRLKEFCRAHKYSIHTTHKLWFLGFQNSKHNDFYIETKNNVYSVKLFGILRRNYILIFADSTKYLFRRAPTIRQMVPPSDGPLHPLPSFDFYYKYRNEWDVKIMYHVLLVNPVGYEILTKSNQGPEMIIGAGDLVNGMAVYSLSRFMDYVNGDAL